MAMLCYVLAALCLVYCVGVVATKAAGTKFYLIWLAGTALFGLFGFFIQKGLWMRLPIGLRAGIGVLAGVGIACLCGLLILIGSTFSAKGEQQLSYLIVLGAQMKPNGPSVVLEKRLRRAYTYLTENPETLCVLSGGQGSNEPVSEAQGMYEDLVKKGIDPKRLILEDQSTNTVENLQLFQKADSAGGSEGRHCDKQFSCLQKPAAGKTAGLSRSGRDFCGFRCLFSAQ